MKIYYSPEYAGHVYITPKEGGVQMDTVVVNTIGLVTMLELRLGLHYEDVASGERLAHYFDAMSQYMKENPRNLMAASFCNAGLSTAQSVLAWRDQLRMAGWDFDGAGISERLQVLVGVEELFRKKMKGNRGCDMAGRLHIVTDQVGAQHLDCKEIELLLPCEKELLRPAERRLLMALQERGATISMAATAKDTENNLTKVRRMILNGEQGRIELDEKDESLLIYEFEDERAAHEYLSFMDMVDVEVWVNADNKQMDNWLGRMNKPLTGSRAVDCLPRLTQLFVMGVGLFADPLNMHTLIEWLNMPVHPVDRYFRSLLADAIAKEGGYRNETCRKLVKRYVDGDFVYMTEEERSLTDEEQQALRLKDKKKRQRKVNVFLPALERGQGATRQAMTLFANELAGWAKQRAALMRREAQNDMWVDQLHAVAEMAESFGLLLDTQNEERIDPHTIDTWLSIIYTKDTYINALAQQGCRTVVDETGKLISVAKRTVWMGVEGDASHRLECDFLYPSEKRQLVERRYIDAWEARKENRYHELMMLTPLMKTQDQLIMVVCRHRAGEPTEKHPLIVRLEQQVKNIGTFIKEPCLDEELLEPVEQFSNGGVAAELQFEHAENLKWPDHVSPTTMDKLTEYPLEYMMEHMLNLTAERKAQMADVNITKGNVAHTVIEALFAPRGESRYSRPEEIAVRIEKEYEDAYLDTIEAKGAILQLSENKLGEKLLHEQLRNCLDVLNGILRDNHLKVTGCEEHVVGDMQLGLPKQPETERDVSGYIDMTLEDVNGHPVVFDFKWSTSDYYQKALEKNRSVQLEMYRHLLSRKTRDVVEKVAYFQMPEARLYSQEKFEGRHCTQVQAENTDNIVLQLRNSIVYRKEQLSNGIVETGGALSALQYVKDTERLNLFPLEEDGDTGMKRDSRFANYGIFSK